MQTRRRAAELQCAPLPPDPLTNSVGRIMPRPAYDAGRSAPAWSEGATGAGMQSLGIEETLEAVDGVVGDWCRWRRRSAERVAAARERC